MNNLESILSFSCKMLELREFKTGFDEIYIINKGFGRYFNRLRKSDDKSNDHQFDDARLREFK